MKKLLYIVVGAGMLLGTSACSKFLEPTSPSVVDPALVFSDESTTRRVLLGAYAGWEDRNSGIHSVGIFYDLIGVGSDAERHAESFEKQKGRTVPEYLYPGGTANFSIDYTNAGLVWTNMYAIIAVCNNIVASVEKTPEYAKFMSGGVPTKLSHTYGEAVALRASAYFELLRIFGDLPHTYKGGHSVDVFTSRDEIYEYHINKLISVEPVMYRVGENGQVATSMNRTYVQGLIGRMCLYAGGYATRRTDLGANFYKNLKGETLTFTQMGIAKNNAVYNRRTDYLDFYRTAKTYLAACVANPGSVRLITTDDRAAANGRQFGNPFQRKYQYMNDRQVSPETVYEIAYRQGAAGSERPYSFGRGSSGGVTGYPGKSYGQCRMWPTYYYGDFSNKDMRRDVTVTATGSSGNGAETLMTFQIGSVGNKGGLCLNKWDENRMSSPISTSRQSGISCLYMSFSDVILMLAEVHAELGESAQAKAELTKVRSRAFASTDQATEVTSYINSISSSDLVDAVLQERKLEFGGEGMRRYDLIRSGRLPKAIKKLRDDMIAMVTDLESQGYHTFANGNQISTYIWTKSVDPKIAPFNLAYRLTTQCADASDPVLFPGWRGQFDDWTTKGLVSQPSGNKTNLAIKGLFSHIADGTALESDGYTKVKWGQEILGDAAIKAEYTTDIFNGYTDASVSAGDPPIYLCPLTTTILQQKPKLSNGYGFKTK